jgi:hypothetical protein
MGGYGDQQGNAIVVDASGNIYVAGETSTPDFPVVLPVQSQLRGAQNAFVAKILNSPAPAIALSPSTVSFSPQVVGTTSSQQQVTVTNIGTAALSVSSVTVNGPFSAPVGCSASVAPNATCTIQAPFTPTISGSASGQINIYSNATILPEVAQLMGTGQDFSIDGSAGTSSVSPGQTATYSLSLTPESGFAQKITLTCAGVPLNASCAISPASITLDGTNSASVSVTVTTSARSALLRLNQRDAGRLAVQNGNIRRPLGWQAAFVLCPLSCVICFVSQGCGKRARILLALLLALSSVACGGGGSSSVGGGGSGGGGGTAPGTYTITVTGTTVGNLSHGLEFPLMVN